MATSRTPSIETLPVEILHYIFDSLDTSTIIFSVRPVSRLFRAVVGSYNRYALDCQSITLPEFRVLCRLIHPQNVTSLTLRKNEHTPDQISPFLLSVRLRQFTQLHQITFDGIEQFQLNKILKHINHNTIKSFSLTIGKYDDRRKKTTLNFLSSIMAQSSLRKVELNISSDRICNITWPTNCSIRSLIIHVNFDCRDIYNILSSCGQLRILILKQGLSNTVPHPYLFPQLTSLTIEELDMTIDQLESILMSTPSLNYLKLVGKRCVLDGKRWETFAQIHLSHLTSFEFSLHVPVAAHGTESQLESMIESFRSSFWIEYKQWFVAAEFHTSQHRIHLFTIPLCEPVLRYALPLQNNFVSNCSVTSRTDPSVISRINELTLSTQEFINANLEPEEITRTNLLFPQVTKVHINIGQQWSSYFTEFLSAIIAPTKLVEVKLGSFYFSKRNESMLMDLLDMIEQLSNLSSLIISGHFRKYKLYPFLDNTYSRIPPRIANLQIPLQKLEQIKMILDRCPHLSRVQFEIPRLRFSQQVMEWFDENTINSTCRRHRDCTTIWIGERIDQVRTTHKRVKLSDDPMDS